MKKTYYVTIYVDGRWCVPVEAENPEQAIAEAEMDFEAATLDENFEVVTYKPVIVEEEFDGGNIVWEA